MKPERPIAVVNYSVCFIEIVAYEYMDVIRKVWRKTLEIFFPAICVSCSGYLGEGEVDNLLCNRCFDSIEIL